MRHFIRISTDGRKVHYHKNERKEINYYEVSYYRNNKYNMIGDFSKYYLDRDGYYEKSRGKNGVYHGKKPHFEDSDIQMWYRAGESGIHYIYENYEEYLIGEIK